MNDFSTRPISEMGQPHRQPPPFVEREKHLDSRVKGVVLPKIEQVISRGESALFPSSTTPQMSLQNPALNKPSSKRSKKLRHTGSQKIPIGLKRGEPGGWVNAWMQFLIHFPSLPELFAFTPRSFDLIREFIDQYREDQLENRQVSSADGLAVLKCLTRILPGPLLKEGGFDVVEIFRKFMEILLPHFAHIPHLDHAPFHPGKHLLWDFQAGPCLEEMIQQKIQSDPQGILVLVGGEKSSARSSIQRQFCIQPHWRCYDLDLFMEKRPNGTEMATFITYVKVEGVWYQCDEERVAPLRSSMISIPLQRSEILHYKKL